MILLPRRKEKVWKANNNTIWERPFKKVPELHVLVRNGDIQVASHSSSAKTPGPPHGTAPQ